MNFLFVVVLIWAVAMGAWFLVSKYVKSSDLDRVKSRLLGNVKAKKKGDQKTPAQTAVITKTDTAKNQFAQQLVEKYHLGPRMGQLLEQAGLSWTPARLLHMTIMTVGVTLVAAWFFLPIPPWASVLVALAAGAGPYLFVARKRKLRLRKFEEIFPDTLEFVSRSMRAGHAFSVSLEMIHREFPEPVAGEFRRTFEEHNLGLPIEVALQKLSSAFRRSMSSFSFRRCSCKSARAETWRKSWTSWHT